MTVSYVQHVATADKMGAFLRLLFIWRGGVFKGIWRDLFLYILLYAAISVTYRFGFSEWNEEYKMNFERLCVYFRKGGDYIPLSFILGFYVTQVVNRWWLQFTTLPWPDNLAMNLVSYLPGGGEDQRRIRRKVVRLASLANILALRRMSTGIARRFPTYEHLVEAGLLTHKELLKLDKAVDTTEGLYQVSWVPIQWAQTTLLEAKNAGYISSDLLFSKLQESLQDLSTRNRELLLYGWINVPLVYTQLVTIAVHVYFMVALFGRQYLTPSRYKKTDYGEYIKVPPNTPETVNLVGYDDSILDFYFPFFLIMQFIFYFGWLKVAEILINPFGDDDDDFDSNYIVDRNYQVSYLMVDQEENGEEDEEDFEDDLDERHLYPPVLPHTVESYKHKEPPPVLPTDNMVTNHEQETGDSETDTEIMEDTGKHNRFLPNRRLSVRSCVLALSTRSHSLIPNHTKTHRPKMRKISFPRSPKVAPKHFNQIVPQIVETGPSINDVSKMVEENDANANTEK